MSNDSDAREILAEMKSAILKTMTSQEYQGPGGRRQRMADLLALHKVRKDLIDEVNNSSTGSMCELLSLGDPSL